MNIKNVFPAEYRSLTLTKDFEQLAKLPPAKGLKEVRERLTPEYENVWYEYIPKSYNENVKTPLVVQLHGGGNDGRIWADITIWHLLADKHGFIVVYPNSPVPGRWNCDDTDINFLVNLINYIKGKYNIDESRVYMQGMSNGEMMTLAFTLVHPEMLAAAGYMTGPSPAVMIGNDRPVGALPLIQMRGEKDIFFQLIADEHKDIYEKRYSMNDLNRKIWKQANGIEKLPAITIKGKNNFLVYEGDNAPIINWEIRDMGHREPPEGAQIFWDYMYSGCRRVNGKLEKWQIPEALTGDADSSVLALGSNKVYKKDHIEILHESEHGYARYISPSENSAHFGNIKIDEMFETKSMYIPVQGLQAILGAKIQMINQGDSAIVELPNGDTIQFYASSLLAKHNDVYCGLKKPSILISGIFYVPIEEIACDLLGKHASTAGDAMYIADHYNELGRYTARILREILGGEYLI